MVEPEHKISVRRQCEMLRICRSGFYYESVPTSAGELRLMRVIDEIHLKWPFYGSRKIAKTLRTEGGNVNRKRIQRLMHRMTIGHRPYAGHQQAGAGAREIPVFVAQREGDPGEPGLGHRHHLHSDGTGLRLPRSDHGLVLPARARLARFADAPDRLLHRCAERGIGEIRKTGHFQYGSGVAVY